MPPKRKKGASPAPRPAKAARRTSQRNLTGSHGVDKDRLDTTGLLVNPELDSNERKGERWGSRASVDRVLRELGEMEQKLQDAVKKQRLAVETSKLVIDPDTPAEVLRRAKKKPPIRAVINDKPKDEPGVFEKAPADEDDAQLAIGDVVDAKLANSNDGNFETGSKRAPPVNSDQVPLPWAGRLGYVSTPSE